MGHVVEQDYSFGSEGAHVIELRPDKEATYLVCSPAAGLGLIRQEFSSRSEAKAMYSLTSRVFPLTYELDDDQVKVVEAFVALLHEVYRSDAPRGTGSPI